MVHLQKRSLAKLEATCQKFSRHHQSSHDRSALSEVKISLDGPSLVLLARPQGAFPHLRLDEIPLRPQDRHQSASRVCGHRRGCCFGRRKRRKRYLFPVGNVHRCIKERQNLSARKRNGRKSIGKRGNMIADARETYLVHRGWHWQHALVQFYVPADAREGLREAFARVGRRPAHQRSKIVAQLREEGRQLGRRGCVPLGHLGFDEGDLFRENIGNGGARMRCCLDGRRWRWRCSHWLFGGGYHNCRRCRRRRHCLSESGHSRRG